MLLLGIETSTRCAGVALWGDDGLVGACQLVAGARHGEVLLPAIDGLCRQAGVAVPDIGGIAADVGPGLFTGLRVGLATAQALSLARGLPAAGVTSLEALAHPHRRRAGLLASVVDARRGEVFWSLSRSDGATYQELQGPAVAPPDAAVAEVARLRDESGPGPAVLAVGDGAWRYQDLFRAEGVEVAGGTDLWPSPQAVAELGTARLGREGGQSLKGALEPLYLRGADVRIGWEQVGGRVGGPERAS